MRFQDPSSTTRREPTLAEQRARRQAVLEERERAEQAERAQLAADERSETRRKLFIGAGVGVGLVGLVAGWYLVAQPDEVTATCTTADGTVVEDDRLCDEDYAQQQGGYVGAGGFMFIPLPGGGMQQYRYNYGGTGQPGQQVQGGTFNRPDNANITSRSGTTVQRGGFGVSGGSFGSGGA
ncbi:hypothetical protein BJF85_07500 [Saccharomonospora sp. CUA-673]|nr:hypothetical protein [Saccharomonospora sp. CUA-673]OLT39126.1 hypothetical protein BJF85_07500 [Saccharomonospora sp. CUA-673]